MPLWPKLAAWSAVGLLAANCALAIAGRYRIETVSRTGMLYRIDRFSGDIYGCHGFECQKVTIIEPQEPEPAPAVAEKTNGQVPASVSVDLKAIQFDDLIPKQKPALEALDGNPSEGAPSR